MIALVELTDAEYAQLTHDDVVFIPVIIAERSGDSTVIRIAAARGTDSQHPPHEIRLRVPRSTLRIQATQT